MNEEINTILNCLNAAKGDDLERTEKAFSHYTPERMNQEYGASGLTPLQILKSYKDKEESIDSAISWLNRFYLIEQILIKILSAMRDGRISGGFPGRTELERELNELFPPNAQAQPSGALPVREA